MGQICSQCCAREREETIDCPFDCGHLIESHAREKPRPVDLSLYPNLTPSRSFIDANEVLLVLLAVGLFGAAIETPGSVDRDVMECLEAAIRNRQTNETGLIDNGKPGNPVAAKILERLDKWIGNLLTSGHMWPDGRPPHIGNFIKMLAYFRLMASTSDHGRRKGRAFMHVLVALAVEYLPDESQVQPGQLTHD